MITVVAIGTQEEDHRVCGSEIRREESSQEGSQ